VTVKPFEQVVAAHGTVVLRVCRALLGPIDAEDAWADTFLAALRAYPELRPDSDVRAWLVTIAHRKALDAIRATNRRPVPTDELPEAPMAGRSDDARIDRLSDESELVAALAELPFKQRGAVVYHHLAGLPYREVGRLLECSEAAARRNAADGLANLRKRYAQRDEMEGAR
jgi:RNA polymerase sigma factor (sigma-70 family)